MKNWRFNSMLSKKELKQGCGLSNSLSPIENTRKNSSVNDRGKKSQNRRNSSLFSYINGDQLFRGTDNSDDPLLVIDSKGNSYSIDFDIKKNRFEILVIDSKGNSYSLYFDIEKNSFEIENDHAFPTFLDSYFPNFLNSRSKSDDTYNDHYTYDNNYNWNNHINNFIDNYLDSQIRVGSSIDSNLTKRENENIDVPQNLSHLWVQCDHCYCLNYKPFFTKNHLNMCEDCGYHLQMSSSDRIELLIDPGTWNPMDEDMVSVDPFEWDFHSDSDSDSVDPFEWDFHSDSDSDSVDPLEWVDPLEFHSDSDSMDPLESVDPFESVYPFESMHPREFAFYAYADSMDPRQFEWDFHSDSDSVAPLEFHSDSDSVAPLEFHLDSEEEPYKDRIDSYQREGLSEEDQTAIKDRIDSYQREGLSEEDQTAIDKIHRLLYESRLNSEKGPYKDHIDSYQRETGLTEAVQTGIGELDGIPVAIGVMDFEFIGGSMGSVVGEKITRLIEYASHQLLPLILVCASGGARMQEGSLSLMQMAKIAAALDDYQSNKGLFYVSILTSPTTGGVTASFGMLGDIIIAEPNAYIAFAGKRVIEQTLNITVPDGSQTAEYLFPKGLFDPIVPRNFLKGVLSELFQLHGLKKKNK